MKRIKLAQGKFALVDDEDFELVNQRKWFLREDAGGRKLYAISNLSRGKTLSMHTLITGYKMCDHKNGDGLDNRRENLRKCSKRQNRQNSDKCLHFKGKKPSSIFKGVCWKIPDNKWQSRITYNGDVIDLGRYDDEEFAAIAYDAAAKILFGEFANLNFPEE